MEGELAWIAGVCGARGAKRGERLQALWSGYGELFRVELVGGLASSAIVKRVTPPTVSASHRSDARKRRSYEVETAWYQGYASRCDATCRVARFLGTRIDGDERLVVLEDLDAAGFDRRRRRGDGEDLDRCLAWLASFHARFLGVAPEGLWETGAYWHLGTRPDELEAIEDPELRAAAPRLDELLENARHRTLVHGDAKEENFCFGSRSVAGVDFHYVGGGCGMKDVAYLLHGRRDSASDQARALDTYFAHFRKAAEANDIDAGEVEEEWRALYPIAVADFCRFLAGWAKRHWRTDVEGQRAVAEVLRHLG